MNSNQWRFVLAIFGFVLVLAIYYPGVMSHDPLDQLAQSRGLLASTHPPIMSILWRFFDAIVPGPIGMLVFHNTLFWVSLYLLSLTMRSKSSAWASLLIGFIPPVFALLGMIWKDVGMGAALALFVALVARAQQKKQLSYLCWSLLPLFYGIAVRPNAIPAVLPLALAWVLIFDKIRQSGKARNRWRSCAKAIGLTLAIICANGTLNSLSVQTVVIVPGRGALQASMLHDLAALSLYKKKLLFPQYILESRPNYTLQTLKNHFSVVNVNELLFGSNKQIYLGYTSSFNEYDDLKSAWLSAVSENFWPYIQHRFRIIKSLLQIKGIYYPYHFGIDENSLGLEFPNTKLYQFAMATLEKTHYIFFRGWGYALLAFVVCGYSIRKRQVELGGLVALSGILYFAPYFVITSGSDFRYIWWMILSSLLGAVISWNSSMLVIEEPI